ncbi:MAG: NADH-quinone oxidoreductase subunit J [Gammaproteobacteria bacterium]|nr:NADH-quinone oxidoreductase subunit J [Gammaproteobacteria bacterium]
MTADLILFFSLALISIATAFGMLLSRNAIYSALFLIMNFFTIAIFFLILGGAFIAITQITVYAGAIMVLFLFVIMLLGTEKLGPPEKIRWQQPVAITLALALVVEGIYVIASGNYASSVTGSLPEGFGSPASIGQLLFRSYLVPFEVTSILLLVGMIGAIIITKSGRKLD